MIVCPICRSPAEEIDPGTFDGSAFRCKHHGDFEVSHSVLATEAAADPDQWEIALNKARGRADPGSRPRILSYDF
jgi:hypothetical protein